MALIRSVSRPQGTTNYDVSETVTEGGTKFIWLQPGGTVLLELPIFILIPKFSKNDARICPTYLSEFMTSEKNTGPITVVALRTHHIPNSASYNGTSYYLLTSIYYVKYSHARLNETYEMISLWIDYTTTH